MIPFTAWEVQYIYIVHHNAELQNWLILVLLYPSDKIETYVTQTTLKKQEYSGQILISKQHKLKINVLHKIF